MKSQQPVTVLPRYLALSYLALILYASLHPFYGWRDPGVSPLHFIDLPWPRYWTVFDLLVNVVAYFPLGFLLALSVQRLFGRWLSSFTGLLFGSTVSFLVECAQSWLPSRIPSNLDLACNALGATLGAVLALRYGEKVFLRIVRAQAYLLTPAPHSEFGLVLSCLWLLTQLSPETLLFGVGDLRHLLPIVPAVPYAASSFFAMETGIIVSNMLAIGLLVRTLLSDRASPYLVLGVFFLVALSIRALAAAILVSPEQSFAWLTPGAGLGLLVGASLLAVMLLLPASLRIALAGLAVMAGTVLVNLTPANPYSDVALAAWRHGHFLNFNGLTRLAASFWPFLAMPFLMLLGRRV